MLTGVDPLPRVQFYVDQGLVSALPTPEQLRRAGAANDQAGAGVGERIRYYLKHPLDLFPTANKKRRLRKPNSVIAQEGLGLVGTPDENKIYETQSATLTDADAFDRFLRQVFLWSPPRFLVQCIYNPYNALKSDGLAIPSKYLISHILHAPHPSALWDVMLLHPDPGALDELAAELERARSSRRLRYRVYRAMAQREGYYDYLGGLIDRVRRFDYPPPTPGFVPRFENVVTYLNFSLTL